MILRFLLIWLAAGVPVSILVGKMLKEGSRG